MNTLVMRVLETNASKMELEAHTLFTDHSIQMQQISYPCHRVCLVDSSSASSSPGKAIVV
jgi:hypothetical protein